MSCSCYCKKLSVYISDDGGSRFIDCYCRGVLFRDVRVLLEFAKHSSPQDGTIFLRNGTEGVNIPNVLGESDDKMAMVPKGTGIGLQPCSFTSKGHTYERNNAVSKVKAVNSASAERLAIAIDAPPIAEID
ncbi:hypothetical protein TIFTF001_032267 [Ficus carica]|uniref:Uncharacterized protein n=1 Tax=Ficus carica TaxID=3494 RepID=A0AA88J6I0_FICCA|nr:hypothetical protein TIFTF001_032267 [Ficus carica]